MSNFEGYLFSKLDAIGSRSEGPLYYLQLADSTELLVANNVGPWQEDPGLHKYVGKKVTITGKKDSGGILHYEHIEPLKS